MSLKLRMVLPLMQACTETLHLGHCSGLPGSFWSADPPCCACCISSAPATNCLGTDNRPLLTSCVESLTLRGKTCPGQRRQSAQHELRCEQLDAQRSSKMGTTVS